MKSAMESPLITYLLTLESTGMEAPFLLKPLRGTITIYPRQME